MKIGWWAVLSTLHCNVTSCQPEKYPGKRTCWIFLPIAISECFGSWENHLIHMPLESKANRSELKRMQAINTHTNRLQITFTGFSWAVRMLKWVKALKPATHQKVEDLHCNCLLSSEKHPLAGNKSELHWTERASIDAAIYLNEGINFHIKRSDFCDNKKV